MKKVFLTVFFAFYNLFAPFVVLNCAGEDLPYEIQSEADNLLDSANALQQCEAMRFLTQDCVEIIQAEKERIAEIEEAIATAYDDIADFISCRAFVSATATDNDTESTTTTSALNCAEIIGQIKDGFEACESLTEADRDYSCDQIFDQVTEATTLCTGADATVSTDFCSELS